MDATFSEFSYGFAVTREIASGRFGSLTGAPVFPSQYREGRTGGGYDVNLPVQGIPLFLQFKLSHCLVRSSASEWHKFGHPYYRMYLRPLRHSNQHALLTDLQNQGNSVYYVAPRFHTVEELNEAYGNGDILERSAFFPPASISLGNPPDIDVHYMAFHPSGKPHFLCSQQPKETKEGYTGKEVAEIERIRVKDRRSKVDEIFFEGIADAVLDVLTERSANTGRAKDLQSRLNQRNAPFREAAEFAAYLTRVFLDAELFVVGESNSIV